MIVLHGALATDGVWLWGESRSGDPDLVEALAKIGLAKPLRAEPVVAWLPTSAGVRIASSPLIADPPPPKARTSIAPWTLRAGRLTTAETIDILARCIGKTALAPGVFVGHDLAYAATVAAVRGRARRAPAVLPAVERAGRRPTARRGLRVLEGARRRSLGALGAIHAGGLPRARHRIATRRAARRPSPAVLLRAFVEPLVDHLVRGATPEEATVTRATLVRQRPRPVAPRAPVGRTGP